MVRRLMKKYALSEQGAKDYIKACVACTVVNLVKMLPVGLLFLLVSDLIEPLFDENAVLGFNYWLYGCGILGVLALMYITNYIQYNCNYFNTYSESAARRIALAERMRKLPLSYFGKKIFPISPQPLWATVRLSNNRFPISIPNSQARSRAAVSSRCRSFCRLAAGARLHVGFAHCAARRAAFGRRAE